MEEIFKNVESVLANYPSDWTKNYYENKKTVEIIKTDSDIMGIYGLLGLYNSETNSIELKDINALTHELFHMAFNDRKKYHQRIFEEKKNPLYDNGLIMYSSNGNNSKLFNRGVTEGLVEYLTRKCSDFKGQEINHFFVDLLISIFGEDLLKYPFTNDPIGFYCDPRFDYINNFCNNLDTVNDYFDQLIICYTLLKRNEQTLEDFFEMLGKLIPLYNISLIETFNSIVTEFRKYSDRLIDYEQFRNKINNFADNYDFYKTFDNEEYNVKKYLKTII